MPQKHIYHTFINTLIVMKLMSNLHFFPILSEYSHSCYWDFPVVKTFAWI